MRKLLVLVMLAWCGNQIDGKKTEASIVEGLAKKGIKATASCPSGVAAKANGTFDCTVTDGAGKTHTVNVTQQDDQGTVLWKLDGSIVDMKLVAADAKAKIPGADIACPSDAVVVKPPTTVECSVKQGAEKRTLIVKVEGDSVGWELK